MLKNGLFLSQSLGLFIIFSSEYIRLIVTIIMNMHVPSWVLWLPSDLEGKKKKIERKNNAKFIGHYVCPRTHNMRAHALRSHHNMAAWIVQ